MHGREQRQSLFSRLPGNQSEAGVSQKRCSVIFKIEKKGVMPEMEKNNRFLEMDTI
jgi:hypothetical protein